MLRTLQAWMVGIVVLSELAGRPAIAQSDAGGTAPKAVVGRWSSNVFSLIRAESVQKELVLSKDQKLKLAPLVEEYDMGLVELSKQPIPEPGNRPGREERSKAFEERQKKADVLLKEKAPSVIAVLTAEQSTRLSQIMLQKERGNALNESDVRAKLSITSEQQHKLIGISQAFVRKVGEAMRDSRKARPVGKITLEMIAQQTRENSALLEKLSEERDAAMMAVLTPTQVEQFKSLRGKEFDVKSLLPMMPYSPTLPPPQAGDAEAKSRIEKR